MITNLKKQEYLKRLMDLGIPEVYQKFPKDFHVDVNGWSFVDYEETKYIDVQLTDSEVAELKEHGLLDKICHISGNMYKIKRLRTMDIELASDDAIDAMNTLKKRFEQGEFRGQDNAIDTDALKREFAGMYRTTCTQRCPHCFNQEDDFYVRKILDGHKLLKWSDMKQILTAAKKIGLESVKFLGIGEIFKIPDLFSILDDLRELDIKIGIFTKGTALGDDKIAKDCGYEGIETAEELVRRLSEYDNVSILLGGNSFVPEIQDRMVGCGKDGGVTSYTEKRDRALKLLVKYGFNDPVKGKRLALVAAPVTPEVSDETVVMYEWAMHRNITVITIPTMVSGKGTDELEWLLGQFETNKELISRYDENNTMTREERYVRWLSDFYSDIYMSAVSMGITDLETLKAEGISGYAGAAKCQQMHNGMYIRLPGTVQECPGRCVGAEIADDIRDKSLLATWIGSKNYDRKDDCRALCAVKMKNLTGTDVMVCDCCTVYDNVGSMPLELERDTLIALEQKLLRGDRENV